MKGPFSKEETEFLQSLIYVGLKSLKDVGKGVNYEDFCNNIVLSIPDNILAPEFIIYWENWKQQFEGEKNPKKRKEIFAECILDIKNKGLIPSDTSGLTGNFSQYIATILSENPTL